VESGAYYGKGYEDVQHRRPSIRNARRLVDWRPEVTMERSVERTLDFFLRDLVARSGDPDREARAAAQGAAARGRRSPAP